MNRELIRERDMFGCIRCGARTGLHVHHRRMRSQGGKDGYANCITLCSRCHTWVHANPEESHAAGLMVWAGEEPSLIKVRHIAWPMGPILLRGDGTVDLLPPSSVE